MSKNFRQYLPTALLCLLLSSCGSETAEVAKKIEARDELVRLRLKEIERADRLPASGQRVALTEVDGGTVLMEAAEDQFAQTALVQLQRMFKATRVEEIEPLLATDFESSKLRPSGNPRRLENGVEVSRSGAADAIPCSAAQFLESLQALGQAKIKVLQVDSSGAITTEVRVEADRDDLEYSGRWKCTWLPRPSGPALLRGVEVQGCGEVRSTGDWFIDATRSAIGQNPRFDAQVMRGIEYWSQRITRIGDLAMAGHHGIAVGDVNGDGLEDVYACDGGSLPNQLYLQRPDGSADEVAAEWDVAWLEDSRSALLVDLDNDGDQDLVVATIAMITFAENTGKKFELRGGFPGAPYPFSLSAADFDSDGDLDLYTCVYSAGDESISGKRGFEAQSPIPFNDANNGGKNVLLMNLGEFRFSDVTAQIGLDQNNTRWSFSAAWEDYDRDGDPDLYVANDFGRNSLYRNDRGQFTDVAAAAGVEDMAAGMSVSWGDFNCDGAADLCVGNMFSAAGSRIGYQQNYASGLQRMARGNSLFVANGAAFVDVSLDVGITVGGWAWSSALADLDNDGWQDLIVTNGYLTNTRDDDL